MNDLETWCFEKCNDIVTELGTGHAEVVYHNAFLVELRESTVKWENEKILSIVYKGIQVGTVRADVVIENEIVIEFKAVTRKLNDTDVRQLRKYMDITGIDKGMLVNFTRKENNVVEHLKITN